MSKTGHLTIQPKTDPVAKTANCLCSVDFASKSCY